MSNDVNISSVIVGFSLVCAYMIAAYGLFGLMAFLLLLHKAVGGAHVLTVATNMLLAFGLAAILLNLLLGSHALALEKKHKLSFVHPFDDPDVIAGQGTVGMEILRQHPGQIHAVFVAVGGGGLIAGVGAYIKAVRPDIKIIGDIRQHPLYQDKPTAQIVRDGLRTLREAQKQKTGP